MKTLLVVSALVLSVPTLTMAGDSHNHEAAVEAAPHGGSLRASGEYKAEIVINDDKLKLYIYDKKLKPKQLEKTVLTGGVQFPKEKVKPISFKKNGDFYESTIKGISKVHRYDLHVNIEADGKKTLIDFGLDNI